MSRLFLTLALLLGCVSCFKETANDTTYILKPSEQIASGDDYTPLEGVILYAFAGSSSDWEVASYDDALVGIVTSVDSGEQRGPFATSQPYGDSATDLQVQLDRIEVMLVAIDTANGVYAYSNYTVPQNLSEVQVDIVFRTWRDASYTASTWTFIVPEQTTQLEE